MAGIIQVRKPRVWFLLLGAIVLLLGVKVGRPLLAPTGPPIALDNQPALLFVNNEDGCECIGPLYENADAVISGWSPAERAHLPLHQVVLDDRPDLQRRYNIERTPMLLLLNADGDVVWREWRVASNPDVFDLDRMCARIALLGNDETVPSKR